MLLLEAVPGQGNSNFGRLGGRTQGTEQVLTGSPKRNSVVDGGPAAGNRRENVESRFRNISLFWALKTPATNGPLRVKLHKMWNAPTAAFIKSCRDKFASAVSSGRQDLELNAAGPDSALSGLR
jgi:hypothetical protein